MTDKANTPNEPPKPAPNPRPRRRRPIEVKKPAVRDRDLVSPAWIAGHTLLAWAVIGFIFAGLHFADQANQSGQGGRVGMGMYGIGMLIQGVLFAGYFVSMGRAAGMSLATLITAGLIGAAFPFWGSFFFVIPFGLGHGLLLPVGWLFLTMRSFSYRWPRIITISIIAAIIFGGWNAALLIGNDDPYYSLLTEQIEQMALIWHLLTSLVCVLGVNERRRVIHMQWREYVRYRPTCPSCRYRFKGIPKSATHCPECGETIPEWVTNPTPATPTR